MVGKSREKTPLEKATEARKKAFELAKEKASKPNANAADKAAMASAEKDYRSAKAASDREFFTVIGGNRVGVIITKIEAFSKLATRRAHTEVNITEAFAAIRAGVDASEQRFKDALANPGKTAAPTKTFKFS
jgi:hypothetical protein